MRSRRGHNTRRWLIGLALAAGPLLVVATVALTRDSGKDDREPLPSPVHAYDLSRETIYHSPQRPGYTAWVGAWQMPDGDLMTGFVQATGPLSPAARSRTPASVLAKTGIPRPEDPRRDFWGLDQRSLLLRSSDRGRRWSTVQSERFQALGPYGYTSQATVALKDGTLLRRVNGDDLRHDGSVPHTAFLQRLAPGSRRWSAPQVLIDPAERTYQLSRIRYLRDGRLIATGNVWDVPADTPLSRRSNADSKFLLMVSENQGRSWREALTIPPVVGRLPGLEWDVAELPDGDLAAMMRTLDGKRQVRKQALLERDGDGFEMTHVRASTIRHSGHPELLATRQGPVLDISTTGVSYTRDGLRWEPLRFAGGGPRYVSNYYPRSIQTRDGVIHVFGHKGFDDPYGKVDQSITMDTFRLARGR